MYDLFSRKKSMRQLIVLICLICANTLTYAQQVTLSGKVEDAYTGKGLQGVMAVSYTHLSGKRSLLIKMRSAN